MIKLVKTTFDNRLNYYIEYTSHLRLTDTYWEQEIEKSALYDIFVDDVFMGVTSIKEDEHNLTSLCIEPEHISHKSEILSGIISVLQPKTAFVVSNDEPLLTLFTDYMCENKSAKLTTEAFFFDNVYSVTPPEKFASLQLRRATVADVETLKSFDFFDNLSVDNPADVKYLLVDETGEVFGAGHIQSMKLAENWRAVGMVTSKNHRHEGVGKAIISMEKKICEKDGYTVIAGCYYSNLASKATLEACGFSTKTRMYRIIL